MEKKQEKFSARQAALDICKVLGKDFCVLRKEITAGPGTRMGYKHEQRQICPVKLPLNRQTSYCEYYKLVKRLSCGIPCTARYEMT